MKNLLTLNREPYTFTEERLPALITYSEGMGGSHFSLALMTDLFTHGSKVLLFTAYPMAKENFLQQTGIDDSDTRAIILPSGNETAFIEALQTLSDIHERVILVKNIETFSTALFDTCLGFEKIIFSGDLEKCVAKDAILAKEFATTISFTEPGLEKYTASLTGQGASGVVRISN